MDAIAVWAAPCWCFFARSTMMRLLATGDKEVLCTAHAVESDAALRLTRQRSV